MTATTTLSPQKALMFLKEHAEKIKCGDSQIIRTVSPGDVHQQGDIYFLNIRSLPKSAFRINLRGNKLVEGDSEGSQHTVRGAITYSADPKEILEMILELNPKSKITENLLGPIVVFRTHESGQECPGVPHPRHGDLLYEVAEEECIYVMWHQRSLSGEKQKD
jgi:hypothetical protein